jgi:hypothetical protein
MILAVLHGLYSSSVNFTVHPSNNFLSCLVTSTKEVMFWLCHCLSCLCLSVNYQKVV